MKRLPPRVAKWLALFVAWLIAGERIECTDRRGDERRYRTLGRQNDKAWRGMTDDEREIARGIVAAINQPTAQEEK